MILRNILPIFPRFAGAIFSKRNIRTSAVFKASTVLVEKLGDVVCIGINRPEKRNCVDVSTGKLLREAFEEFDEDPESLVAVLHGVGGNFCAGFDLEELSKSLGNNSVTLDDLLDGPHGLMGPTRMKIKKPVIAAVNGYAVAGGLELALMCDLRVMEENAIVGVFCRRFGVPLIDGGTVRLPAIVGLGRAMDLILTGRAVGCKEALEMGLINRAVAVGTGLGQAVNLARALTKFPMECMKADKMNAYCSILGNEDGMKEKLDAELSRARYVIREESVKGATKFVEEKVGRHGKFSLDTKEAIAQRRTRLGDLNLERHD
ncbi:unnamed protein product [Notodromas monacha]|uniref:Enoyl-CoA hydratase n=1 Tax=Notodromas monacha TaxID=399045 RepID=A0A7R9GFE2_9CRUS|nr:unnamed protein product [Notodromas monacha]CAG0920608.1 unnamed protein product [Notodromas monacha]